MTPLIVAAAVLIVAITAWFGRCTHREMLRERRDVKGARGVMHLVCTRCGHAVPTVDRSAKEHRAAVKVSRTTPRTQKPRARIFDIEERRSQR